jgi:hypothetical protein
MKSESGDTVKTFATLRIVGDQLVPEQVTGILKIVPARAYGKGETYHGGERTGDLVGKTGVWYFATDRRIGVKPPAIPRAVTEFFRRLPAEIETDFDTDEEPAAQRFA